MVKFYVFLENNLTYIFLPYIILFYKNRIFHKNFTE